MSPAVADKRRAFRLLHEGGIFVMPNPWDRGSAHYLATLGFPALATTSAGMAFAAGRPDGGLPLDEVLAHLALLAGALSLPLNADFENGFAHAPEGVAANVVRAAGTGIAGLSIEDFSGDPARPFYTRDEAAERIRAARAALDAAGADVVLTGRAEAFLHGHPDPLRDVLDRLPAYAEAGADVLYAPGLRTADEIAAVVKAVAPKPVNVLRGSPGLSVRALEDLGVRRVSLGGALARAAWGGLMRAAREIAERGSFEALADNAQGDLGFATRMD